MFQILYSIDEESQMLSSSCTCLFKGLLADLNLEFIPSYTDVFLDPFMKKIQLGFLQWNILIGLSIAADGHAQDQLPLRKP